MMKADVTRQMVRFMETDLPEKKQIDLTVPQNAASVRSSQWIM